MLDNLIVVLFFTFVIVSVIGIASPRQKDDPLLRPPTAPRERNTTTHPEPVLNDIARNPARSRAYVSNIANEEQTVTDDMVLQSCYEIVNNNSLTSEAKIVALDALAQQTANNHPDGMRANVLDILQDESTAVMYPHWTGAHGDFISMKRG